MKILIEHGANVNLADNDGHTPLHVAALKGKVDHQIIVETSDIQILIHP